MSGFLPGERIYLVDAHNAVHRLYHAVPLEHAPSDDATPVNAVIGWVRSLRRLRQTRGAKYLLPIFDGPGDGWRKDAWPDYKTGRKPHDAELVSQWPLIRAVTEALQLPVIEADRVEADDLVASYAEAAVERGLEVIVVSSDKDLLQLVRGPDGGRGSVRVLTTLWSKDAIGQVYVCDRYGVGPELLADFLALAGDKSDAIPGVPGIGAKTARDILVARGSLERALDEWMLVPGKAGERLRDHADQARLCRRLVGLDAGVSLPVPLDGLRPWRPHRGRLDAFFRGLGYPRFEAAVDRYRE